ncbi:hypothetical protein ABK040_001930 [Willaertia magna]
MCEKFVRSPDIKKAIIKLSCMKSSIVSTGNTNSTKIKQFHIVDNPLKKRKRRIDIPKETLLHYSHNYSQKETCEILHISISTLKRKFSLYFPELDRWPYNVVQQQNLNQKKSNSNDYIDSNSSNSLSSFPSNDNSPSIKAAIDTQKNDWIVSSEGKGNEVTSINKNCISFLLNKEMIAEVNISEDTLKHLSQLFSQHPIA